MPPAIRIYPELRAAHLLRDTDLSPAEVWYFRLNGLAPEQVPPHHRRVTVLSAVRRLVRSRVRVLEVPEPLWARFLPITLLLLIVWRGTVTIRGGRGLTCTYAIENNDAARALFGGSRVPRFAQRATVAVLGWLLRRLLDRIAFGSTGAERAYAPLLRGAVESRTFEELPRAAASREACAASVVFVGALEHRKGVEPLLAAWEQVERARPSAHLTVVGGGPLAGHVARWTTIRPHSREAVGPVAHSVARSLIATSSVLAAPSVRDGRWREQIGLPIKEALAAGLTVVTTSETGLAPWLSSHGHTVLDPATLPDELAAAIVRAIDAPLPRRSVRASLPLTDGRICADAGLHDTGPRGLTRTDGPSAALTAVDR